MISLRQCELGEESHHSATPTLPLINHSEQQCNPCWSELKLIPAVNGNERYISGGGNKRWAQVTVIVVL